jgi:hypothetical protein
VKRIRGAPIRKKLAPEGGVRSFGLSTGGGQAWAVMVTVTTGARGPSPCELTALTVMNTVVPGWLGPERNCVTLPTSRPSNTSNRSRLVPTNRR